ncbi:MAG: response regulator, partial [Candidatus Delongbacteria bacterium]
GGREALSVYRKMKDEIILVLLDMIMPDIDGKETYRELVKINRDVKVIMTSGFARDKRIEDVLSEGANDFIQKPYTIYKLTDIVYGVIHNEQNRKTPS